MSIRTGNLEDPFAPANYVHLFLYISLHEWGGALVTALGFEIC